MLTIGRAPSTQGHSDAPLVEMAHLLTRKQLTNKARSRSIKTL